MSDESTTTRLQRKIEELLARDLSTMGHEAKAHHARRIDRLKEAKSYALAHADAATESASERNSGPAFQSGPSHPTVRMS